MGKRRKKITRSSSSDQSIVAFDTETNGLYRYQGHRPFGYSICNEEGNSSWHRLAKIGKDRGNLMSRLLENRVCVGHNMKFDLGMVRAVNPNLDIHKLQFHDTMIQAHVLQNDFVDRKLKRLAWELAGVARDDEKEVKAFVKEGGDYSMVPDEVMEKYAACDAERTMLLHLFFWPKIQENKHWLDSYNQEIKLIPVTLDMEDRGVMLNVKKTKQMRDKLLDDAETCLDELEYIAGERLNPASPDQLQHLLFNIGELPILERTEKSKQPKTSKDVLESLKEKFPDNETLDLVMQYRSWKKGAATFQRYLNMMDSDGVIHPNINTCAARTGRESCSDPNLQNVQKDSALLNPYPVPERSVFRPRPGYVWVAVDYSGIELRLLVHYSRDEELIDCINVNGDPHALAAELFYGKEWRKADKDRKKLLRSASKNANFSIPYGANGPKVAAALGKKTSDGKRILKEYQSRWPGLAFFNRSAAHTVREKGYVETTFGRRLYVPRDKAYIGANYLIQGTAAEVLKRAQINAWNYCQTASGGEVYPLLPIHDEIIFEYPRKRLSDLRDFMEGLSAVMTDFPIFSVPMNVEAEIMTASWNKKKELKFDD
jgi:DNA polymerase-1